ncbi:MAG: hypothetical protein EXR72_07590 [Myxococcales bacterium]|nr:hypothetical protein [Myxococcales bacterium]
MKDIFEAVEKLSALLSFSVQRVAGHRGWAAKPYSFMLSPATDRTIMVVSTSVHLPLYRSCGFTPHREPDDGGKQWGIDVRRTDGVARESWASGLTIRKTDGKFQLMYGAIALSDDQLNGLLEDLGSP